MIIAIDGPAAAGKGTLAKMIAEKLGYSYLDTGSLYRAVAVLLKDAGWREGDVAHAERMASGLTAQSLNDPALRARLRDEETGRLASMVASIPEVRAALLEFQRRFAANPPMGDGAVIDGRDIGTVVCPEAACKLFVTATDEVRAQRRTDELLAKGIAADFGIILSEMRERDRLDRERAASPLKAADDAEILDTSEMTIEEVFSSALSLIYKKKGL